jgi:hypothetical protein
MKSFSAALFLVVCFAHAQNAAKNQNGQEG